MAFSAPYLRARSCEGEREKGVESRGGLGVSVPAVRVARSACGGAAGSAAPGACGRASRGERRPAQGRTRVGFPAGRVPSKVCGRARAGESRSRPGAMGKIEERIRVGRHGPDRRRAGQWPDNQSRFTSARTASCWVSSSLRPQVVRSRSAAVPAGGLDRRHRSASLSLCCVWCASDRCRFAWPLPAAIMLPHLKLLHHLWLQAELSMSLAC